MPSQYHLHHRYRVHLQKDSCRRDEILTRVKILTLVQIFDPGHFFDPGQIFEPGQNVPCFEKRYMISAKNR